MPLSKEEVAANIQNLEEQEKITWANLNKILGAKEVYIGIWNRMEEEEQPLLKVVEGGTE
jgi:hypothetical protein